MEFVSGIVIALLTGMCIRLWLDNRKNVRAIDGAIDEMKARYAYAPDCGVYRSGEKLVRACPNNSLREPVRKFEDTFSAQSLVLGKFFKKD